MLRRSVVTGARTLLRRHRTRGGGELLAFSSSASPSSTSAIVPNDESSPDANLPAKLIDFAVAAKIEGEESHVATIQLRPGEMLRAESGSMIFMTEGVVMDTKLNASSAMSRFLTGQNLFLTDFHYEGTTSGTVCLGTDFPSKIMRFSLEDYPDGGLICQKGAYLASNPSVNIEMEFTKSFSAGFFGGEGFILQKLTGEGDVLVKGGGTIVNKVLKDGETLRVTSGSIVAFESTIQYDVQMMPGIKNAMFGGEGLFVTTLQGPGQVWLQGMPPDRMISEIARRVPGGGGIGLGIPIGMGGGGGGGGDAAGAGVAGADEAAAGAAGEAATSGGGAEDMVAATDAAIEADRNATVASSGMAGGNTDEVDADSPSALFGDAAPASDTMPKAEPDASPVTDDDSSSFASSSNYEEQTFAGDDFSTSSTQQPSEPTFDDGFSKEDFSTDSPGGDMKDGELFDDTASSPASDTGGADEESSGGLLQTLWDFFTDED